MSTSTASAAAVSGECSRVRSRSSRSGLLGEHGLRVGADLGGAAARALLGRGGEEDLQLGVGRDDRPDVAALGDVVPVGDELALALDERGAHLRPRRDLRRARADLRRADQRADVLAVERHAAVEADRAGGRVGRAAQVGERDGAVHRAGVEVREAERRGDGARDGGLAGARGPVDGDEHRGGG